MPIASARVRTTPMVCGSTSASIRNVDRARRVGGRPGCWPRRLRAAAARWASCIASAAAVASSSRDAPATANPVRSVIIVWKFSRASSRPWEISGWYGV
jgi:hypothetical protein